MNENNRFTKNYSSKNIFFIISTILLINIFFNLFGITWGLPSLWYPDEKETIEKIIIPMAVNFDINPHIFFKTSFYYYFSQIFLFPYYFFIKFFSNGTISYHNSVSNITLITRLVTAITGTAGVYLIYRIGTILKNVKMGLIAALILSINLGYISYSHFAIMEILLLFEIMIVLLFIINYLNTKKLKFIYWISFLGGLTISTKYNAAVFILISFLICHFVRSVDKPEDKSFLNKFFSGPLFISTGLILLGFFLGTPFSIFDYKTFLSYIIAQSFITKGYKVYYLKNAVVVNLNYLKIAFGSPLFYLLIMSYLYNLLKIIKKFNINYFLILITPITYFSIISSWHISALRYTLFIIPFSILILSQFIYDILSFKKIYSKLISFFLILILLYTINYVFLGVRCFTNDTREKASKWINTALTDSLNIELYSYQSYLPRFPEHIKIKKIRPNFIRESTKFDDFKNTKLGKFILVPIEKRDENSTNKSAFTQQALNKRSPDYIVLSSFYYDRYVSASNLHLDTKVNLLSEYYRNLLNENTHYKVIKIFSGNKKYMQKLFLNPDIIILKRKVL